MSIANESDDRVLELVRTALQSREVQLTDNLFDAGADSLTLLDICTQIEEEFKLEIPLDVAWGLPTIADLAAIVRNGADRRTGEQAVG
jgi:acyl carrier protein